ncbi:MAG: amidohydrolase family protein [Acidobacteriota bacterium]|nr:amidohydrolase family protein [Acidobacteriota bacterium]
MSRVQSKMTAAAVFAAVLLITVPAAAGETTAVRGAKVVTGTGEIVEGGIVLVRDGLIVAVGKDVAVPEEAKIVDVPGGWIFPGFIDALTDLGAADRPSRGGDSDEATDPITPQLRIVDAVDPGSEFIARARTSGLTAALAAPALGNLLSGQSALIRLSGDDVADMIVRFPVAVHGSLGEPPKMRYGTKGRSPQTRMGSAALLRQTLWDVRNRIALLEDHDRKRAGFRVPPAADSRLDVLIPIVKGESPLVLNANRMDDILTALRIAEEFGLKLIISGGAEAHRVKERLAASGISVLLRPADAAGPTEETARAEYGSAAVLFEAGVRFAFQTGSAGLSGDLLSHVRSAVAHGLPWEEALRAVTVSPAGIFGAVDRIGSLEAGKFADMAIFDGNPFREPARAVVVMIGGKTVFDRR